MSGLWMKPHNMPPPLWVQFDEIVGHAISMGYDEEFAFERLSDYRPINNVVVVSFSDFFKFEICDDDDEEEREIDPECARIFKSFFKKKQVSEFVIDLEK